MLLLPNEIIKEIFCKLDFVSLTNAMRINKNASLIVDRQFYAYYVEANNDIFNKVKNYCEGGDYCKSRYHRKLNYSDIKENGLRLILKRLYIPKYISCVETMPDWNSRHMTLPIMYFDTPVNIVSRIQQYGHIVSLKDYINLEIECRLNTGYRYYIIITHHYNTTTTVKSNNYSYVCKLDKESPISTLYYRYNYLFEIMKSATLNIRNHSEP
jgi:hypothetical protein